MCSRAAEPARRRRVEAGRTCRPRSRSAIRTAPRRRRSQARRPPAWRCAPSWVRRPAALEAPLEQVQPQAITARPTRLTRSTAVRRWPWVAVGPTLDAACVSAEEVAPRVTSSASQGAAAASVTSRNQRRRSSAAAAINPTPNAIQAPRHGCSRVDTITGSVTLAGDPAGHGARVRGQAEGDDRAHRGQDAEAVPVPDGLRQAAGVGDPADRVHAREEPPDESVCGRDGHRAERAGEQAADRAAAGHEQERQRPAT